MSDPSAELCVECGQPEGWTGHRSTISYDHIFVRPEFPTYVVYFYDRPKDPVTDRKGRTLVHNGRFEFSAEDILALTDDFEVWVSVRDRTRYVFLDKKGYRFHQR